MKNRIFFKITREELIVNILILLYFILCIFSMNHMMINWLGIFCYIYCIITWKCKTKDKLFSLYFIFMTFFFIFNYGQPCMWALNIHQENEIGSKVLYYGTNYIPSEKELIKVQLYVCLGMLIFHFGAMMLTKRNNIDIKSLKEKINYENNEYIEKISISMRLVSKVLLMITTPIAIYSAMQNMKIARLYGYNALYYGDYATQSGYTQIIMYFFFPSLIGYLISNKYSKRARIIVYTIFGLYTIFQLLSGDRGSWLYSLVILFWLHSHYNNISIKKYLKYIIIGIIGIYALNVVTIVRDSANGLSSLDFSSILSVDHSPIVDTFFELGGTMEIITFLFYTGNSIFPYTNTYIVSILGVVSSRVLNLIGIKQILIADWFSQEFLKINWGAGFSMIGETFINGGYIGGLFYMGIIGAFMGLLMQYAYNENLTNNPLHLFITVAGLNAVIGFSRGALYLTLKELFYGTFIVVILIKICYKVLYRR